MSPISSRRSQAIRWLFPSIASVARPWIFSAGLQVRRWRRGRGARISLLTKGAVEPALILCPLLGFDRAGGRLGQGGGHYDRYFATHPHILRIGVGWSVQEVDAIPAESTDARLDAVLTEQEFIVCGDRL
jgi:5-formyltetrahydrofolate cyclo-ligase